MRSRLPDNKSEKNYFLVVNIERVCTIIGKRRGYNVALSRGRVDDVLVRHIEDCCYYNFCKNVWWFVFSHDNVIYIDWAFFNFNTPVFFILGYR
jgi:hypothetical protein